MRDKQVSLILVGLPRNMDGSYGPAAQKVQEFVAALQEAVTVPIKTLDERLTSVQANRLLVAITDRMVEVGLRLHPDKTKIVYCKDGKRRLDHEHTDFTFLGYTFRPGRRGAGTVRRSPRCYPR